MLTPSQRRAFTADVEAGQGRATCDTPPNPVIGVGDGRHGFAWAAVKGLMIVFIGVICCFKSFNAYINKEINPRRPPGSPSKPGASE